MSNPLFSIITVTYNADKTIGRTLDSVIQQNFENYEHIIIDGASKDNTLAIIDQKQGSDKRIVKSERDAGLYDAMNKGINTSNGSYLIFLNAGDKFHSPQTLREIAEAIKSNNAPDIVYGQTNLVDDNGVFIAPRHLTAPENLRFADFARGMLVCHQAFIAKKEIVGQYSMQYRYSADYEWCIRCLKKSTKNIYIDKILIDYLSEGMTTANRRKSLIERFKIMSKYYGFFPTLFRHFGFIGRFVKHQKQLKKN